MIASKTQTAGRTGTKAAKRTRPAIQTYEEPAAPSQGTGQGRPLTEIPVEDIASSPNQPRTQFGTEELQILADSVADDGILQPIGVRPVPSDASPGGKPWELIWGERRLRAAKIAGCPTVLARICDVSSVEAMLMTGDENLFRRDWNAIETARYYAKLTAPVTEGGAGMHDAEVGTRYHCSRTWVIQLKSLLRLPRWCQDQIAAGKLSPKAGKFIVRYVDQPAVMDAIRQDMHDNPEAWRTSTDVERNSAEIADRYGAKTRRQRPKERDGESPESVSDGRPGPGRGSEEPSRDGRERHAPEHATQGGGWDHPDPEADPDDEPPELPAPASPQRQACYPENSPGLEARSGDEQAADGTDVETEPPRRPEMMPPGILMTRLAESFPSLRGLLGVKPWDANELFQGLAQMDPGQRLAAQFCLHVWKPGFSAPSQQCPWNKPWYQFDVFAAFSTWDAAHWNAFLYWTRNPILDLDNARRLTDA